MLIMLGFEGKGINKSWNFAKGHGYLYVTKNKEQT